MYDAIVGIDTARKIHLQKYPSTFIFEAVNDLILP